MENSYDPPELIGQTPYGAQIWVCKKCSKGEGIGLRGRFPHEICPRCDNPSSNMVLVRANETPS